MSKISTSPSSKIANDTTVQSRKQMPNELIKMIIAYSIDAYYTSIADVKPIMGAKPPPVFGPELPPAMLLQRDLAAQLQKDASGEHSNSALVQPDHMGVSDAELAGVDVIFHELHIKALSCVSMGVFTIVREQVIMQHRTHRDDYRAAVAALDEVPDIFVSYENMRVKGVTKYKDGDPEVRKRAEEHERLWTVVEASRHCVRRVLGTEKALGRGDDIDSVAKFWQSEAKTQLAPSRYVGVLAPQGSGKELERGIRRHCKKHGVQS